MNMIKRIITILLSSIAVISCVEKESPIVEEQLEVNAHNISGSWKLVEWNGTAMFETTYMYVKFVRNDRTFTIY